MRYTLSPYIFIVLLILQTTISWLFSEVDRSQYQHTSQLESDTKGGILPVDFLPDDLVISRGNIAKSPINEYFAIATSEGQVILWNPRDQSIVQTFAGTWNIACATLAWSPDGNYLVAGIPDKTVIWDTHSGKVVHTLTDGYYGESSNYGCGSDNLVFSSDSTLLAIPQSDGEIHLRRVEDGNLAQEINNQGDPWIVEVVFSPDSRLVAIRGMIRTSILEIESGSLVHTIDQASAIAFSHDGQMLGVGIWEQLDLDHHIIVLNTSDFTEIATYRTHLLNKQLEWSTDDQFLFANLDYPLPATEGPEVGSVVLQWDMESDQIIHRYEFLHEIETCLELESDEILLSWDNPPEHEWGEVYNINTKEIYIIRPSCDEPETMIVTQSSIERFNLNSDTTMMVTLLDYPHQFVLWDLTTGEQIAIYTITPDPSYGLYVQLIKFINNQQVMVILDGDVLIFDFSDISSS